ncbi:MAG: hypothetical protein NVS2B3_18690 [Vulcanimicrobiaceae bacterium]
MTERRKRIGVSEIGEALSLLRRLAIAVDPAPRRSIARHLEIARCYGPPAYDAASLELAERLNVAWYTADERLSRASRDREIPTTYVA